MPDHEPLTYQNSGVDYNLMDPFKIACQRAAQTTSRNLFGKFLRYGLEVSEPPGTRGETAYSIDIQQATHSKAFPAFRLASVIEGLGTKNEVADQIWQLNLKADLAYRLASVYDPSLFRNIGIDNVASVINDLSAVGAIPTNFALFIATSSSSWFKDQGKTNALIQGTVEGCNIAKCSWGNGETQTLRGPIADGHFVLAGSANGLVFPNHNGKMNSENLTEGDDITLFASSGPHTNGITFLRNEVAPRLTNVYETLLSDGKTYAEALLTPTKIYAPLIDALYNSQIRIKYASPITGHGWRKIMRADRNDLIYVIDQIPATPPIFEKVQEVTRMSDQQMYSDFNMGIGFAIMTEYYYTDRLHRIAEKAGFKIAGVGHIESGPKKVVIVPLGIELTDLNIR